MYRGTIIDAIPNGSARIALGTGEIATIPWQDIAKIERCSAAPVAAPATGAAAAATASGPDDGKSLVWVHVEGSTGELIEQDKTGFNRDWEPVCKASCDRALSPAYSYRIVGDGIRNSAPFALRAPPGQHEVLGISEGSKGGFVLGIVATAGGGAATLTGLLMVLLGEVSRSAAETESPFDVPHDDHVITAGWVTAGIGAAILAGGIALTISNAHTVLSQVVANAARAPTPARQWARSPIFTDTRRDAVAALPPVSGLPLLGGRF